MPIFLKAWGVLDLDEATVITEFFTIVYSEDDDFVGEGRFPFSH